MEKNNFDFNNRIKKKKTLILTKKNIFTLSITFLLATAIITVPLVSVANLVTKDPRLQVQNQAKLISAVNLKDQYLSANSSYFDIKKQLFNNDNSKKTGVDFSQFFDFYQKTDPEIPINFATDYGWEHYKIEILDLIPLDQEQSFEIYYRLLQELKDGKTAISDPYKQKVAYSHIPDYSLSNFVTFASQKLEKLRAYSSKEFNFSTKKGLTKLISVNDFEQEVNSAKTSIEARAVLDKYFNLEEVIREILDNENFSYLNEIGTRIGRYQIELTKDQILKDNYLVKQAQKGFYKLTFFATLSASFAKEIGADLNKSAKFHFGVNLDFNNLFLDKTILDNIKIEEFSETDYFTSPKQAANFSTTVNGWDFLNYYNNQIFATEKERQDFLLLLIGKIVKTPILDKIKFSNELAGLDYPQLLKYLKLELKLDTNATKLAVVNNKIVAKIFGKILLRNLKNEVIAEKSFSQIIENLELLAQNDPEFASKMKKTVFYFEPRAEEWISASNHKGVSKEEIIRLLELNKFERLKKVLENPRYYGYRFDENRLKLLVDDYKLPSAQEFAKTTTIPGKISEGIVNFFNSTLENSEQINRFLALLAKKDINFVAKFWYDFLAGLKLIDAKTKWPSDLNSNNFFKKLAEIKLIAPTKSDGKNQQNLENNPDFWLFSFNNDYLISNEYLKNSFYLHSINKNVLELMKTNTELGAKYFVEQIRQHASQIKPKDFLTEKQKNKIQDLTSFLLAFYSLVYSKDQGLFTETLGENFGYKIQFKLDPVLANVSTTDQNEQALKIKYWYNIGPIDQNGNLISIVNKTKQQTLNLKVNKNNKLLSENEEKLDEIVAAFPTSDQFVFLTKKDYQDFLKKLQATLAKEPDNKPVKVDKEIMNLPFSRFFALNYENYGFYALKTAKTTDQSGSSGGKNDQILGVIENSPAELGNQSRYNLFLYVYNKKHPEIRSTMPIKVIIIESSESLFASN